MDAKRGYIPDGTGVRYRDKPCTRYETGIVNDDHPVLFLSERAQRQDENESPDRYLSEVIVLTLYEPKLEDLWFRQMMLADEETMSFNHAWGGTIPWPAENWKDWYDFWIANPEGKRYYRYLKNNDDQYIGEIAYHYDADIQHETANVIIYSQYRRKGYGSEALDLLCSAAKSSGISVLYDDIAIDNSAIKLFLKHGFTEEYRTEDKIYLRKEL